MTWMPWILTQCWAHLLYLHSRVDVDQLQALLPAELEVDTFDGDAWVTLIPLRLEKVHLRDVVPVPNTTEFPELNLRTCVRPRGESGVWFLSLDASSWFSVQIARLALRLPYCSAAMSFHADGDGFAFSSRRADDRPSVSRRGTALLARRHQRPVGRSTSFSPSGIACSRPHVGDDSCAATSLTASG
jgi:uncharacterized protein YqjF (DUF2071 family)